ncbi:MAG: cupredoxin domain-containing protein [Candidatus Blackburnbacteria bacterium]|nr:cupredoxin domain-containing protein [Candidatus Blackburnbacteria bacterium]
MRKCGGKGQSINSKMQNKLFLIGIGILGVVAIAGFFITKNLILTKTPQLQTRESSVDIGNTGGESAESLPETMRTVEVSGKEYSFSPNTITLNKGEKTRITFKNEGTSPHNFVVYELGIQTEVIPQGQSISVEVTPDKAGEYPFVCNVGGHQALGMEGKVIVK